MLRTLALAALLATAAHPAPSHSGDGSEVMLQGFHWFSYHDPAGWYNVVRQNGKLIQMAGFQCVWFPPPSASAAPNNSYLPTQWYDLNNGYGTRAQLSAAIEALQPDAFAICDIVLNHRCGKRTAGTDFADPPFADNAQAVVSSDESGQGQGDDEETHANGEPCAAFGAGRDLNHRSAAVQQRSTEFLGKLAALGFQGWRYDLVRGYHGSHVGDYNDQSAARFSVGEFADPDPQTIVDWIAETGQRSLAFDFPTRYRLAEALQSGDYGKLTPGVIGLRPELAVTFVENHDCQPGHEEVGKSFPAAHVAKAYVYILTHPGVPCVFWNHFFGEHQKLILDLIRLRKSAGLRSTSKLVVQPNIPGRYAAILDDKVAVKLGPATWSPGPGWQLSLRGPEFAVWQR